MRPPGIHAMAPMPISNTMASLQVAFFTVATFLPYGLLRFMAGWRWQGTGLEQLSLILVKKQGMHAGGARCPPTTAHARFDL